MDSKLPYKRILIIKTRGLGDAIIGLSTLDYIKELAPKAELIYGVTPWITPLFQDVIGPYNQVVGINLTSLTQWMKSWFFLKDLKVDAIIELHQSGRNAKFLKLFSRLTNTPYFFHNHHDKSGKYIIDQGIPKASIQRDLDGVYSIHKQGPIPNYQNYLPKITPPQNTTQTNTAIFGVVATREEKKWPLEHYYQLGLSLIEERIVDKIIIPLSNSKEDQWAQKFFEQKNNRAFEIISCPLNILPSTLSSAKFYIGNDTGLKHICIALGLKTLTLFGPENPKEWHPYDATKHPYIWANNKLTELSSNDVQLKIKESLC